MVASQRNELGNLMACNQDSKAKTLDHQVLIVRVVVLLMSEDLGWTPLLCGSSRHHGGVFPTGVVVAHKMVVDCLVEQPPHPMAGRKTDRQTSLDVIRPSGTELSVNRIWIHD